MVQLRQHLTPVSAPSVLSCPIMMHHLPLTLSPRHSRVSLCLRLSVASPSMSTLSFCFPLEPSICFRRTYARTFNLKFTWLIPYSHVMSEVHSNRLRAGFSFVLGVQNRSFLSFGKASVKASRKRRKKRRKKRREKRRKSVAKVSQKASQKASRKRRKNVGKASITASCRVFVRARAPPSLQASMNASPLPSLADMLTASFFASFFASVASSLSHSILASFSRYPALRYSFVSAGGLASLACFVFDFGIRFACDFDVCFVYDFSTCFVCNFGAGFDCP